MPPGELGGGRRRSGRDPTSGLPRETRPAEGGGGSPGSAKGGAGADPATAGQTHGPEGARPPAPLVPPWVARAPGYLSVGPMQAVSVLSISRRIRSCSAAVSRLSASAILPRSIDWGAPQRVLPLQLHSPDAPTLPPGSRAPSVSGCPQDDPSLRLDTPPCVTASADVPRNTLWDS